MVQPLQKITIQNFLICKTLTGLLKTMRRNMAEIQIIYRNKRINNKKGVLIILTTLKTYKSQMVFNNLKINKKHLIVKEIKVK